MGFYLWRGGEHAPDAPTLAQELADQFKIESGTKPELPKVSQVVELRKGRLELETFLKKRLSCLEPDAFFAGSPPFAGEQYSQPIMMRGSSVLTLKPQRLRKRRFQSHPPPK